MYHLQKLNFTILQYLQFYHINLYYIILLTDIIN